MPGASCTVSLACSQKTRELGSAGTPTSSGIPCSMSSEFCSGMQGLTTFGRVDS
jgi:hypothetical protein